MSTTCAIGFQKQSLAKGSKRFASYGDTLPYIIEALDTLSDRHHLVRPSAFVFDPGTEIDFEPTPKIWHPCSTGLKTFRTLLKIVEGNWNDFAKYLERPVLEKAVIHELNAFIDILNAPAAANDFFHILPDR
jgi:hypothetical protein